MATYTRPFTARLLSTGIAASLAYTVENPAGVDLITRTTGQFTEVGSTGVYFASIAGFDTSWTGRIILDDGADLYEVEDFVAVLDSPGISNLQTSVNAIGGSLIAGVTVAVNQDKNGYALTPTAVQAIRSDINANLDKTGYSLGATGLDAIPLGLSGPRSAWKFPQWMMFKALRLARSRKDKATGNVTIYDAATQNTVIYTLATTDTDTEQTVGGPA